jgi:hypothetical protein
VCAYSHSYRSEQEQLKALQERFDKLKVEYDAIMEERRLEKERREKIAHEMQVMVRAALLLQKFWRAYRYRKAKEKQAKKKGAKGKKGKKK